MSCGKLSFELYRFFFFFFSLFFYCTDNRGTEEVYSDTGGNFLLLVSWCLQVHEWWGHGKPFILRVCFTCEKIAIWIFPECLFFQLKLMNFYLSITAVYESLLFCRIFFVIRILFPSFYIEQAIGVFFMLYAAFIPVLIF